MAIPPEIVLRNVTYGPETDFEGNAVSGTLTFVPSEDITWVANGQGFHVKPITVTLNTTGSGSKDLICTDQAGFRNAAGEDITNWWYTVSANLIGVASSTRKFLVPSGVGSLDLDTMIPVSAGSGVTISIPAYVASVAGRTGVVSLTKTDVGLGNVDNTSDAGKPVSAAVTAALNSSTVIQLGAPAYALPTYPALADAALAAAYAATPVGGTLDLGDRDIALSAELTIAKRITVRRGRVTSATKRPFYVTAAGVTFDGVSVTRTATDGTGSGSAITWQAADGVVNNVTAISAVATGFEGVSGAVNGLRITGGYFECQAVNGGNTSLLISSGSGDDNVNIKISGATVRHTGYGSGLTIYNAVACTIEKCDVRGIRGNPFYVRGNGDWTLYSGSVWRTPERTDGVQSNSVYVGADVATFLTTKVEYGEGASGLGLALAAGTYVANGDGYIYIRLSDSSDPNNKSIRTRRTNGYGILLYSTSSSVVGIENNLLSQNYVSDTDGFGIYIKAGQGTCRNNRTYNNVCEDVCLLGSAVSSLPYAGIGVLASASVTMVGDVVRRAGTADWPVPGFKFYHDAFNGIYPKVAAYGLRAEQSSQAGFNISLGNFTFTDCTALDSGTQGFTTGVGAAGDLYVTLNACNALNSGVLASSNAVGFSGSSQNTRVTVIGGRYITSTLRGIQLTSCIDSKIIGPTIGFTTQQAINIATCTNLYIAGVALINGNDVIVDSGTTGLTLIPGTESTGSTYTVSCAYWRIGHQMFKGTGSPESVVTAAIGATYSRVDGSTGTALYVKESGTGTTGWVAQTNAAGGASSQWDALSTFGTSPGIGMAVGTGSQAVSTANVGYVVRVKPMRDLTLNFLTWFSGTVSAGNYDIGVYNAAGTTKLWSKGSTAWPTASSVVAETVSPGVAMTAGTTYLIVLSGDTTTATFRGSIYLAGQGQLLDGTHLASLSGSSFPLGSSVSIVGSVAVRMPLIVLRET